MKGWERRLWKRLNIWGGGKQVSRDSDFIFKEKPIGDIKK